MPRLVPNMVSTLMLLAVMAVSVQAYADGPRVAVFPMKNNGQAQYTGLASGL